MTTDTRPEDADFIVATELGPEYRVVKIGHVWVIGHKGMANRNFGRVSPEPLRRSLMLAIADVKRIRPEIEAAVVASKATDPHGDKAQERLIHEADTYCMHCGLPVHLMEADARWHGSVPYWTHTDPAGGGYTDCRLTAEPAPKGKPVLGPDIVVAARRLIRDMRGLRNSITEFDHAPWVTAFDKLVDAL